jgi:hypothetical protein
MRDFFGFRLAVNAMLVSNTSQPLDDQRLIGIRLVDVNGDECSNVVGPDLLKNYFVKTETQFDRLHLSRTGSTD